MQNVTAQEILDRLPNIRCAGEYDKYQKAYICNATIDNTQIESIFTFDFDPQDGTMPGEEFVGLSYDETDFPGAFNSDNISWVDVEDSLHGIIAEHGNLPVMIVIDGNIYPTAAYSPSVFNESEPHNEGNPLSIDSPFNF